MWRYNSQLYVGPYNSPGFGGQGCEVWRYDGAHWTQVVGQDAPSTAGTGPGFGDAANISASSLEVLGSYLYVGTDNYNGCEVWRFDGSSWTQMMGQGTAPDPTAPGFGDSSNGCAHSMAFMGSNLFVGTYNNNGCEVWRYNGSNWTQMVGQGTAPDPTAPGFGDVFNATAWSMTEFAGRLYVGTERSAINKVDARAAGQ